jgi:hypothetical protein
MGQSINQEYASIEEGCTKGVCSHHNPIFVFDRKDRRASDDGLPARGLRLRYIEIARRLYCVCCVAPEDVID